MSEVFSNCDEDISKMCTRIQQILTSPEENKQGMTEVKNCIEQAQENLKQMEIELEGYDHQLKQNLKQQFQLQKQKVTEMKKIYENICTNMDKEKLFGHDHQQEELLKEQYSQFQLTQKLEEAKMVAYGIEKDGNDIQINMHRNNEVLRRNIDKSKGIRSDLTDSFTLLKIMRDRIRNNKLVFYVVGGIVLFALLVILFLHMN